jgi:hypothetical protein
MGVARWMVDFMDNPFFKIDELGVALFKKKTILFCKLLSSSIFWFGQFTILSITDSTTNQITRWWLYFLSSLQGGGP